MPAPAARAERVLVRDEVSGTTDDPEVDAMVLRSMRKVYRTSVRATVQSVEHAAAHVAARFHAASAELAGAAGQAVSNIAECARSGLAQLDKASERTATTLSELNNAATAVSTGCVQLDKQLKQTLRDVRAHQAEMRQSLQKVNEEAGDAVRMLNASNAANRRTAGLHPALMALLVLSSLLVMHSLYAGSSRSLIGAAILQGVAMGVYATFACIFGC